MSVCTSCNLSHVKLELFAKMQDIITDLWPVNLAIIILSSNTQDFACLESAHQIGLTVFLHQRRMRFSSHSNSLEKKSAAWEQDQIWFCHYMFMHVLFYSHTHSFLYTGNGVLALLFLLMRSELYYAQSSKAPDCPDISVNHLMKQLITHGNQLLYILVPKMRHLSWQEP